MRNELRNKLRNELRNERRNELRNERHKKLCILEISRKLFNIFFYLFRVPLEEI